METKITKMVIILICIFINANVFATGSIVIEGHVLSIDFRDDEYLIENVIVKSSNGEEVLYESDGCFDSFCSFEVGPELPNWVQVWVKTDNGIFRFYKVANL